MPDQTIQTAREEIQLRTLPPRHTGTTGSSDQIGTSGVATGHQLPDANITGASPQQAVTTSSGSDIATAADTTVPHSSQAQATTIQSPTVAPTVIRDNNSNHARQDLSSAAAASSRSSQASLAVDSDDAFTPLAATNHPTTSTGELVPLSPSAATP